MNRINSVFFAHDVSFGTMCIISHTISLSLSCAIGPFPQYFICHPVLFLYYLLRSYCTQSIANVCDWGKGGLISVSCTSVRHDTYGGEGTSHGSVEAAEEEELRRWRMSKLSFQPSYLIHIRGV